MDVKQLSLDADIRMSLAHCILATLEDAMPGSLALLRGSLAKGSADAYSDIDILWEVPDELFQIAIEGIAAILAKASKVESLRFDPNFQNSDKHRLIFVQFEDMPLFWRVDIDIFARSIQRNPEYDVHNVSARGNDWSSTHSALMNVIAALKALLRGKQEQARQFLVRGFERVGLTTPAGTPQELIIELTTRIAEMDPAKTELTHKIRELHQQVFD